MDTKFAQSQFVLHLRTHSITASHYNIKLARLRTYSAFPSSLDHRVVEQWSKKAESPSSTLRRTSHVILREFVRKTGFSRKNVGRGWEDMTGYPAMMNHTNCFDLWTLSKCACDQELGKTECVFCILRWCLSTPGSSKYILPVTDSISRIHLSPHVYI
jgi:hypothetical protein